MEKIIGSLVGVSGHTFDIRYDLFFTTERVIAAITQHPLDNPRQITPWHWLFIGGFWSAGREKLKRDRTVKEKRRSLQGMTPDELASANSRNLAIPYSEIASVEIRRRFFQQQLRFHLSDSSNKERTVRFNLSRKQIPETRRLLELAALAK